MAKVVQFARFVAYASALPVGIYLCIFLYQFTRTLRQLELTAATADKVVAELPADVKETRAAILGRLDTLQTGLNENVRFLAGTADQRLASVQADLQKQVVVLNGNLDKNLTKTTDSLVALAATYRDIPGQFQQNLAPYLDCKANSLCLQGQLSDTLFAVRTTSREATVTMAALNESVPQVSKNVQAITDTVATATPDIAKNIAGITANVNRLTHPHWYDRLLGYGINGAILYRTFNPTSITVKAVSEMSSRP